MGNDPISGKNYDHRRQWMHERLDVICEAFCIDVMFLSLLSNHFHLVLSTHPRLVKRLGDWEVARRWLMLCPVSRDDNGQPEEPSKFDLNRIRNNKDAARHLVMLSPIDVQAGPGLLALRPRVRSVDSTEPCSAASFTVLDEGLHVAPHAGPEELALNKP